MSKILHKIRVFFQKLFAKEPSLPKKPSKVVKVKKTMVIDKVLDLKGQIYQWDGPKYKRQKEGQDPIFKVKSGGVKNGWIIGAPDGIHLEGKGTYVKDLVFPEVCEDAVTILNDNCTIENCIFKDAEDKCIQHNKGSNSKVINNLFIKVAKAYRLPDHAGKAIKALFKGNKIYFRGQLYAEVKGVEVTVEDNEWIGVKNPISSGKAKFNLKNNKGTP